MHLKSQTMAFRGNRTFRSLLAGTVGLGVVALSLFSGARAAHAQDGPPPGQDGGGPGGFGGGQGGGFGGPGGGGFGGPGGGFGMMGRGGGGGISQIPFDLLVSQLGLNADQQGKVAIVLIEARDSVDPAGGPGQGGQGGGRGQRQGGQRGGREMEEATQKKVAALLNDEQNAKLKSVLSAMRTLQSAGIPARAATKLNLTSDQITTLAAAAPAEPQQGGGQRPDFQAMQKSMDTARTTVKSTLSSDQLSQVSTYMNRQQGGFGGGQQGGGGFGGPGGGGGFGGGPQGGGGQGGDGPPPAGGNF